MSSVEFVLSYRLLTGVAPTDPVLTFDVMQNGAQTSSGRLLGFVRVLVGGKFFQLPVQAVTIEKDGERTAGGFFTDHDQLGILVEEGADGAIVQKQIEDGTAEAVRHLSQKLLN